MAEYQITNRFIADLTHPEFLDGDKEYIRAAYEVKPPFVPGSSFVRRVNEVTQKFFRFEHHSTTDEATYFTFQGSVDPAATSLEHVRSEEEANHNELLRKLGEISNADIKGIAEID